MKMLTFWILNLLIFATKFSCGQSNDKTEKIEVTPAARYEIADENRVISRSDFNEPNDTVRAALIVDNNDLIKIRFSKTKICGDTLVIVLYEDNEAFSNKFVITIVNDRYSIDYKFLIDISEDSTGIIAPHQSNIKVSSLDFRKGREIRGSISFKGRRDNSENKEWVTVKGNFKAIIK